MASSEIYPGDHEGRISPQGNVAHYLINIWSTLKKTLFIVGSATIVFVALRNTLTYQLLKFWGASGNFWQQQWDNILGTFGEDPFNLYVYGSVIVGYLAYWIPGLLYTFIDITGQPKWMTRYKVQPGTNNPVDRKQLLKLLTVVSFNHILSFPAALVGYYVIKQRGFDHSRQLPTFHWVLFELIVFILVEEIGFYYIHRLFHHRLLYKHYHKLHHEWTAPIALTAVYAHPLEHILSNLLPIMAGPIIMGSHIATFWMWVFLATFSTLNAHSGYHLPFFPSPEAHDFHHLKFNQCYGVLGILDLLHGTDDKFRATKCFSRHIMMLSLTPPREAFPDDQDPKQKGMKEKSA